MSGPNMEKLLPDPVWPYANIVLFTEHKKGNREDERRKVMEERVEEMHTHYIH